MKSVNKRSTSPLKYPRSRRNHPIWHLSSTNPGVAHPVQFIPMFREESMTGVISPQVEMLETKELLFNKVQARFTAWCVPLLAMDRFKGSRDEFDRSFMGENSLDGGGVNAFVQNAALPVGGAGAVPLYKAAGLHGNATQQINTDYLEAYNLVYNHRATQQSKKLTHRLLNDTSLAPAFWFHKQFPHMVADFDRAVMEGEVALNVINQRLTVHGIAVTGTAQNTGTNVVGRDNVTGANVTFPQGWVVEGSGGTLGAGEAQLLVKRNPVGGGLGADIWAELAENGISVSLAGLEEARRLQAFAKLRTQFEGHDDDYIIDMLMQGLSVPDQWLRQPFQIAEQTVTFSQGKRYATDSGNLDDSATSGFAKANLRLRVPRVNTGAVVVVLMEIVPMQLWERQADWFFHARPKDGRPAHDFWPDAERDTLDRFKVDVVYNGDVDVSHNDPTGYFAFEPMNAKYNRAPPTVGGKFHRPSADTLTDDARKRLYAVEGVNPKLAETFFVVKPGTMHKKPFLDEVGDPFEIWASGNCVMDGLTQFGGLLIEQTGNYEAVKENAPIDHPEMEGEVT